MNFRSVADLNHAIVSGLVRLPRDIDVIAGIPRSGMLAANLVALHLNLPLTDLSGLIDGRLMHSGKRCSGHGARIPERAKVLVVDDSVWSGAALQQARQRIAEANLPYDIRFAAVYCRAGTERQVDFCFESITGIRVFEWNVMHHDWLLSQTCMDIDGVLCVDPTDEENDDGPRYAAFLRDALPNQLPSVPVRWLVTCRLEKYRAQTEDWLHRHGVQFGELVMMDLPDAKTRRAAGNHAGFKAEVYRSKGAELFIESDERQAQEIASISGLPVLCLTTRQMAYPDTLSYLPANAERRVRQLARKVKKLPERVARRVLKFDPPRGR